MTGYKALSMEEQIALQRENEELRAKVERLVSRGIEDLRYENEELRGLVTVADERTTILHGENEELISITANCRDAAGFGSENDPMSDEGWAALGMIDEVPAFIRSQFDRFTRENTELTALLAIADERAKLHQVANEELAAHVERLRAAIDGALNNLRTNAPINKSKAVGILREVFFESSTQSLQAIKAEVEDEVAGNIFTAYRAREEGESIAWIIQNTRKYRGQ